MAIELRIEDKKGQEQIYIHAQRDWDENIEHDQKIRVGHERHDIVEANSYTEYKAEEHRTTDADRKVEVKTNDHLTVGQNQHIQLGTAQLTKAGREIHLKAGQKMVIEAGIELTLKAGGSFIKLVCCSRNKFLHVCTTLQVPFLPGRVSGERSGHYA